MEKLLEGIVVLDLTRVLAGPFAGMMLADMGADVIKIETPGTGDDSRQFAPMVNGESSYYMNLNRNKRGITLNLKSEKGREVFHKLVAKADVVLENFRPGVMDRLGFSYEELSEINPRIVYGCVSGFGHYGPYSHRGGYDIIGQAMGGLMSTTGWPDSGPTRSGTAMSDVLAGLSVTIGVLGAVINAKQSGKGQKVDVALVDATVASLEIINQIYLATGKVPERIGNRYESVYPYDSFRCSNGEMVIACGNNKLFGMLADLMGQPELKTHALFDTNPKRVKNHAPLKEIVEKWTTRFERDELVDLLLKNNIPCGPINTIADTTSDPHIAGAREMFVEVEHPTAGKMRLTGSHIKLSRTKSSIRTPAPLLGQHTDEVLSEFGYSAGDVAAMREEGVF